MKEEKSDLQKFIVMLSSSEETFLKEKSGDDYKVEITDRGIQFYFKKNGEFKFCSTKRI